MPFLSKRYRTWGFSVCLFVVVCFSYLSFSFLLVVAGRLLPATKAGIRAGAGWRTEDVCCMAMDERMLISWAMDGSGGCSPESLCGLDRKRICRSIHEQSCGGEVLSHTGYHWDNPALLNVCDAFSQ